METIQKYLTEKIKVVFQHIIVMFIELHLKDI